MSDPAADDLLGLGEGMAPALDKAALPEDLASMLPPGQSAPEPSGSIDLSDPELQELVEEYKALNEGLGALPSGPRSPDWQRMEAEVLDPQSSASITEIATKYGVQENSAYRVSKMRKWMPRKRLVYRIAQKTSALSIGEAASLSAQVPLGMQSQEDQELRMLAMVDRAMQVWDKCLDEGKIQFKTAKDLDTLVRLVAFIQGRAERIIEQRHRLSPKDFEKIVARVQKRHRWSPKLAGVVQDAEFTVVQEAREMSQESTPPDAPTSSAPTTPPDSSDEDPVARPPAPTPPPTSHAEAVPTSEDGSSGGTSVGPDESGQPGTSLGRELVRVGTLRLRR